MRKYLIDLDGTLYRGSHVLPGAAQWIDRLNERRQNYLLCTNCPLHSPVSLTEKLAGMGIHTAPENILTSGMVVKSLFPHGETIALLGSKAYRGWLEENGFSFSPNAKVAVAGYDPEMNYEELQRFCSAIFHGAQYILTNGDNVIPQGDKLVPHTGAIGAAIRYATGREPLVLGKPYAPMMNAALSLLDCTAEECAVVGDRMDTDMEFAFRNGAQGWLLLTGVTTLEEAKRYARQPEHIFRDLAELMEWEDDHQ